jgi:2,3-bisphosphoglycerate-dependent phosphoglycerate mutase
VLIAALIRHADYRQQANTPSAHQPFPLSAAGQAQAAAAVPPLLALLRQHGWQLQPVIDSSCLLRAWQTAQILAQGLEQALGQPFQVAECADLAERGLGSAANLSLEQIEQVLAQDPRYPAPPANWKADSHYCLPLHGAESLLQAGTRVAGHLQWRMQQLEQQQARSPAAGPQLKLFVGHGAAFRHAAYRLGLLSLQQVASLSMHHCQPICLAYSPSGWRHLTGQWKPRKSNEPALD